MFIINPIKPGSLQKSESLFTILQQQSHFLVDIIFKINKVLYASGAIIKSPKRCRVIIGVGRTHMGQTLLMKNIHYLIISSFQKVRMSQKRLKVYHLMRNGTMSKNEYGLGGDLNSYKNNILSFPISGVIYFIQSKAS